uniref:Antitoxin n=1 Tax=Candidatus Desulfatibia profunda TaxID=2841695 RepID=A0A8J6NZ05_9BACT|nr:type II toxin-antitoxin system prevent-host-death family antitoxin [Candidatus Desulfatibia profunda]
MVKKKVIGGMTMRQWKISEAKARFTEVLSSCKTEPQIICNRQNPVGAVISVRLFEELMKLRNEQQKPTVAQLLSELESIKISEPSEIEIPPRKDRPNLFDRSADEMAL